MIPRRHRIYRDGELIEEREIDVEWDQIRSVRNSALRESDWRAGKDVVLSTAWRDYRSALRDLPQNFESANDAADNWPVMPGA
jgi:hypothetical protein